MQVVDIMVAAIAMTLNDSVIITTDSDLESIPGVKIERWLA